MSLKHVAKHLTEQGRGPDDHLVHMSGKEVAGLQSLAMAHGGSLTINPKTGLPEAGFLDDILPTLAVGAGIYAAMYGMPDFSSMSSLFSGAAPAVGEAGAASITPLSQSLPTSGIDPLLADYGQAAGASSPAAAANAAAGAGAPGLLSGMGQYALPVAGGVAALSLLNHKNTTPDNKTKPMIRPYSYQYNPQRPANMIGSTYQPGQDTSERTWFQPQWQAGTPYEAANGGIIALAGGGMAAGGGPVENMSNNAAIGANTMYPMANMTTSAFATPYQDPRSTNMIQSMAPSGGGTVDQMSGEPNMQGTRLASGGVTGNGGINLNIPLSIGGGGGGGGFGGQGANGYNAAGSGGGGYNPSQGVNGPINLDGMRDPGYQQMQQMNQPQGFGPRGPANPTSQDYQNYLAAMSSLRGQPAGNAYAPQAPNSIAQETPIPGQPGYPINTMAQGPAVMQAMGGFAAGGITNLGNANLGSYSDGGRLLRGPGDGVSDSIPAQIGNKQPARLADGEFVVPARIVSELGNGSTEAGAKQLYKMLDRVQNARAKTTAKGKVAHNNNPAKLLPA